MRHLGRQEAGFSLLEVLVSLQLLALVVLLVMPLNRLALGALAQSSAIVGSSPQALAEHPARLRTVAMEYVHAELEYLRSRGYDLFRSADCALPASSAHADPVRTVPPAYLSPHEPRLPAGFARARIHVEDEEVRGPVPDGCYPRRITVRLYRTEEDAAADRVFARAATLLSPRDGPEEDR